MLIQKPTGSKGLEGPKEARAQRISAWLKVLAPKGLADGLSSHPRSRTERGGLSSPQKDNDAGQILGDGWAPSYDSSTAP